MALENSDETVASDRAPTASVSGAGELLSDPILLTAPRVRTSGGMLPAVGGIPLFAKLGAGGMGAVYAGFHPRLKTKVAIKVLPPERASRQPALKERFLREAQLAARVKSPHLVSVLDVDEENGIQYIVMEYVAGTSAGSYIRKLKNTRTGGLNEATSLAICIAAADGLAAAHAKGIVHRDVKPDNILIPALEGSNTYDFAASKVSDLGLAKCNRTDQSLTGSNSLIGTPGYLSPEQAVGGAEATAQSDVFSMGVTLYYLLSGACPFTGDSPVQVIVATLNTPHIPIQTCAPDVSPAVVELIDICLKKKPQQRYADAAAMGRALRVCQAAIGAGRDGQRQAVRQLNAARGAPETSIFTGAVRDTHSDVYTTPISNAVTPSNARLMSAVFSTLIILSIGFYVYSTRSLSRETASTMVPPNPLPITQVEVHPIPALPPAPPAPQGNPELPNLMRQLDTLLVDEHLDSEGLYDSISDDKRVNVYAILKRARELGGSDPSITKIRDSLKMPQRTFAMAKTDAPMEFVYARPGSFQMGSTDGSSDEQPIHSVQFAQAFYIAKYPVTVKQFRKFVDETHYKTDAESAGSSWTLIDGVWTQTAGVNWLNPGFSQTDTNPVVLVSWNDSMEFVKWFGNSAHRSARLPTESEWEYAARGASSFRYPWGNDWDAARANHADAALQRSGVMGRTRHFTIDDDGYPFTSPVGAFPNASWCGCFDLSGNVWQWCADWYAENYEPPVVDKNAHSRLRITRGGSWSDLPSNCRSTERHSALPGNSYTCVGFRIVIEAPADAP